MMAPQGDVGGGPKTVLRAFVGSSVAQSSILERGAERRGVYRAAAGFADFA
jgi:hypothetical protein